MVFPMTPDSERRRYRRFDMTAHDCELALVLEVSGKEERQTCELLDLSYEGMRFRAGRPFQEGEVHRFLIVLPSPVPRSECVVQARICWVQALESDRYVQGAAFLESSVGWLGPEENSRA